MREVRLDGKGSNIRRHRSQLQYLVDWKGYMDLKITLGNLLRTSTLLTWCASSVNSIPQGWVSGVAIDSTLLESVAHQL